MTPATPPGTDRLMFREWKSKDVDPFHAICSDSRVMKYVGNGEVWQRERTGQFIQLAMESLQSIGYCQWALIHRAENKLIGYCGFRKTNGYPEIGWRLAPAFWKQGLATEAARTALQHGMQTLRFTRVTATVQAANVASVRVIDKLGMTLEQRLVRDGREILIYAVDAD